MMNTRYLYTMVMKLLIKLTLIILDRSWSLDFILDLIFDLFFIRKLCT